MQVELGRPEVTALRRYAEENFWFFANSTMDKGFYSDRVHTPLCAFIQKPSRRKAVILPRSFLKTTVANRYALWRATKAPELRVLITSNIATNAEAKLRDIMGIIKGNQFYQACWPELIPNFAKDRWSIKGANLRRKHDYPEATFESAGVGTNLTGRHYNLIDEDDTIAPTKDNMTGEMIMPTREEIEKAIGFHKLTTPLLVSPGVDEKLVIGTRWAEDDLIQFILDSVSAGRDAYDVFSLAATVDGSDDGEAIYHRVPRSALNEARAELGEYLYKTLYLNSPVRAVSGGFKAEWIKYYKANMLPTEGSKVLCVDPADPPSTKRGSERTQDYTAFNISLFNQTGLYVISSNRARISSGTIVTQVLDMMDAGAASRFVVEVNKHAHLEEAFHDEMNRRGRWHSCSFVKHTTPKDHRVGKLSPLAQSGRLFFPEGGSCRNLEYELAFFGRCLHDDEADACAMQLEEGFHYAAAAEVLPVARVVGVNGTYKLKRYSVKFGDILDEIEKEAKGKRNLRQYSRFTA